MHPVLAQYRQAAARNRLLLLAPAVALVLILGLLLHSAMDNSAGGAGAKGLLPADWVAQGEEVEVHRGKGDGTVDVWRETRYVGGIAGITVWENIYLHKGAFHVLSSNGAGAFPEAGFVMGAHPREDDERPPAGPDRWRIVSRDEARSTMGLKAKVLGGTSVLFNDESSPGMSSFLGHYYHLAEIFLSAWRAITSMYGTSANELPARVMFRVEPEEWQDEAGLVTWLHEALLPFTLIEDGPTWRSRAESGEAYFFERLVIVDRFAAHNFGGPEIERWMEMTMGLLELQVSKHWFEPLRDGLIRVVEREGCDFRSRHGGVPVVTYLNRQKTGRKLHDEDARELDLALDKLAHQGQIELHNVFFEDITKEEQFCLVLRTDVMLGVHGNGLTHMLWMKSNSAVIEIMGEGGFAITYPWLARVMGHEHYAVHRDHVFEEEDWVQADGRPLGQDGLFRSDEIRASAPFVVDLVRRMAEARDTRDATGR